ncbi:DUF5959 family protein [Streptomyces virginiae]|uniref:DUF5959 family protein n=1 Tax=Streptomyces virginiae TaxID=1961 RepID=UPI002E2861E4|nr:DUF5959 family protein [Streptomyces virginiae]
MGPRPWTSSPPAGTFHWLRDTEIRIEIDNQFSVPVPIVTVKDDSESLSSVRVRLDVGHTWVDDLREQYELVRRAWPNEVVSSPRQGTTGGARAGRRRGDRRLDARPPDRATALVAVESAFGRRGGRPRLPAGAVATLRRYSGGTGGFGAPLLGTASTADPAPAVRPCPRHRPKLGVDIPGLRPPRPRSRGIRSGYLPIRRPGLPWPIGVFWALPSVVPGR